MRFNLGAALLLGASLTTAQSPTDDPLDLLAPTDDPLDILATLQDQVKEKLEENALEGRGNGCHLGNVAIRRDWYVLPCFVDMPPSPFDSLVFFPSPIAC